MSSSIKTGFLVTIGVLAALILIGLLMGILNK